MRYPFHALCCTDLHAVLTIGAIASLTLIGCGGHQPSSVSEDEVEVGATSQAAAVKDIELTKLGTYDPGVFAAGGAEIAAYDPVTQRLFSVNAGLNKIEVIDLSDPSAPVHAMDISTPGGSPNSVKVHDGVVIAAVQATVKTNQGFVQFFDASTGALINSVGVGVMPDMVTVTPDGKYVMTADEGEPANDFSSDPPGTISMVDISGGVAAVTSANVTTLGFDTGIPQVNSASIRIFGPGATVANSLEPEYIAVKNDSKTAWVTLQEANAVAVVDIQSQTITKIVGLGFKDHSLAGNGFDASDRDTMVNIKTWPGVVGLYQPDMIVAFKVNGSTYLATANEGDTRVWGSFNEEARARALRSAGKIDPACPAFAAAGSDAQLGRLTVSNATGDTDGDGDLDVLHLFGARSFSVWDEDMSQLFDSGDELEQITAADNSAHFNSTHDTANSFDTRSDNKGPEPEAMTVAKLFGRQYGFVGLERQGGVVVYDLSDPLSPRLISYETNRNFELPITTQGDLGPEGVFVIDETESPTGDPLLVISNEISGTTTTYKIELL